MPRYTIPDRQFNVEEAARNRLIKGQNFQDMLVSEFRSLYDQFWQTPLTHPESPLTLQQMQAGSGSVSG